LPRIAHCATIFLMAELIATSRKELGKKSCRVRAAGFVPAVLYGYGTKPQPLSVESHVFEKTWRREGESSVITLVIEGDKSYNVLIQDVALHPIHDNPIHIDFYAVQMNKPIDAMVALSFTGESDALKTLGGVLVRVIQEVEVRALPKDLPHEIEIPLKSLRTFEDQILIKDIPMPSGVEILTDGEQVVALVEAPRSDEDLAALDEMPAGTSVEDIEVTGKKPEESSEEDTENK